MVVGPYQTFSLGDGLSANLYLLRFDENGALLSPQTLELLEKELGEQPITDVFLFSHGWNNTFAEALERYHSFVSGYFSQRAEFGLPMPVGYRPLLVGVIWPSTSFVLPWEEGPVIAADAPGPTEEMLRLVSAAMTPAAAATFVELVDGRTSLGLEEAHAAAGLLAGALGEPGDPDGVGAQGPSGTDLVQACQILEGTTTITGSATKFGAIDATPPAPGVADPAVAGGGIDPRDLLRMGTVWLMKARAGTVGAFGVSRVVQHVLNRSSARLHLIGHSFGARVVMSALSVGDPPTRKARSVLLLEPAVNRWCFAPKLIGTDSPGGFHPVLDRTELPVFSTFSTYDHPLHDVFHLVVRKHSLGEPNIAAFGDSDRYGALGGYGPAGLGTLGVVHDAIAAGQDRYPMSPGVRVVAIDGGIDVDGHHAIAGHGDVSTPVTWWALHCLTGAT